MCFISFSKGSSWPGIIPASPALAGKFFTTEPPGKHLSEDTQSLLSCPTLCDHMDCSPPGFSVHGILQARIVEWVSISFSISVDIKYQICIIIHETQMEAAGAAAKSLQSCPTLCNPIDGSPPGFPVPGILQARTLECVAISFSNAWKWKVKVKSLSRVQLLATPWTAARLLCPWDFPGKSTGLRGLYSPVVLESKG